MKIHNYDTELEELLPCPFCGAKSIAFLIGNKFMDKIKITIKCPKCLIQRTVGAIRQPIEWLENLAIEKWNNRIKAEKN